MLLFDQNTKGLTIMNTYISIGQDNVYIFDKTRSIKLQTGRQIVILHEKHEGAYLLNCLLPVEMCKFSVVCILRPCSINVGKKVYYLLKLRSTPAQHSKVNLPMFTVVL